MMKLIRTIID